MVEYKPKWRPIYVTEDEAKLTLGEAPYGQWISEDTFVPIAVEFTGEGQRGAPDVFARFEIRNGVPETVEFRIAAKDKGRAVRTADLRAWVSLEGLATNAFMRFARLAARDEQTGDLLGAVAPEDEREGWTLRGDIQSAQSERRGASTAELEEVARVYREAIDGRPTEAVQVMLGYSRRTAARRVQQAREAGLLPPTTPGKKKG